MTEASAEAPARTAAPGLPDPATFRATTSKLAGSSASGFDPLRMAADDGYLVSGRARVVAARGVAAVLPVPGGLDDGAALTAAVAWLQQVSLEGPADGPRVMAVGAFPFDRGAPAALVVPRMAWVRDAERRVWAVQVNPRGRTAARTDDPPTGAPAGAPAGAAWTEGAGGHASAPAVREVPPGEDYAEAVRQALSDIAAGRLTKVVLGRMVQVDLPVPLSASEVLRDLWRGEPAFSPFSVPVPGGRLVGASPELIVSRMGRTVTSHAFAGTVALDGDDREGELPPDGDAAGLEGDGPLTRLVTSEKEQFEHRLVVDAITEDLGRLGARLTVPKEPTVVRLRSDARLGTLIRGVLPATDNPTPTTGDPTPATDNTPATTALALLAALHPTPAVGGVPRAEALARIAQLEPEGRGHWAGTVGWVDSAGDGEWVLAIRSALLDGTSVRVRAGAGIVAGSDPYGELVETTVKLGPVLAALGLGAPGLGAPVLGAPVLGAPGLGAPS